MHQLTRPRPYLVVTWGKSGWAKAAPHLVQRYCHEIYFVIHRFTPSWKYLRSMIFRVIPPIWKSFLLLQDRHHLQGNSTTLLIGRAGRRSLRLRWLTALSRGFVRTNTLSRWWSKYAHRLTWSKPGRSDSIFPKRCRRPACRCKSPVRTTSGDVGSA